MKTLYLFLITATIALSSCGEPKHPIVDLKPEVWSSRKATVSHLDTNSISGSTYLSIYSQIYGSDEHRQYNLTALISLRNISPSDTVYLTRADYFNTAGERLRTYFSFPVYLAPLETVEILIDRDDVAGGTGSNFLFDWTVATGVPEPMFEGVMSSFEGTLGVSFTTQGILVKSPCE